MFQRLLTNAKSAVTSLVLKYLARASVAIPFVIAAGFALAAITVMLMQHFGHFTAYWAMAGGLAAIGAIAAIAVSAREHQEEVAEASAEHADIGVGCCDASSACSVGSVVLRARWGQCDLSDDQGRWTQLAARRSRRAHWHPVRSNRRR